MKISQLAAALALMILLTANSAIAQRLNAFDSDSSIDTARHTVLLELSTALLTSSLALNYEYQVQPNIALRLGVGTAFQFEGANASGGTVGAQFYTNGSSRLEGESGFRFCTARRARISLRKRVWLRHSTSATGTSRSVVD